MKVRDSGMPEEALWEGFFDARQILTTLDFTEFAADVVDFGCGYGTFTVAAARLTTGTVYALDIDAQMIEATAARAASFGLDNVKTIARDFVAEGTGLVSLPPTTTASSVANRSDTRGRQHHDSWFGSPSSSSRMLASMIR